MIAVVAALGALALGGGGGVVHAVRKTAPLQSQRRPPVLSFPGPPPVLSSQPAKPLVLVKGFRLAPPISQTPAPGFVKLAAQQAEKAIADGLDKMSHEAKHMAAEAANKYIEQETGTNPGLTAESGAEEIGAAVGAVAVGAAAAGACGYVSAGALAATCGSLGAVAGGYLGAEVGDFVDDELSDAGDWIQSKASGAIDEIASWF